jgi:hypothetical protein
MAGTTWSKANTKRASDGSYTASYQVPDLSATNGSVSIKVEAGLLR